MAEPSLLLRRTLYRVRRQGMLELEAWLQPLETLLLEQPEMQHDVAHLLALEPPEMEYAMRHPEQVSERLRAVLFPSMTGDAASPPWWLQPLHRLTTRQWELLCDGCGQCCHQKFEDEDDGDLYFSNIACRLFDDQQCRCTDYEHRQQQVPDCLSIRDMSAEQYVWLPESCAYRLRANHQPLPDWHPLCSGDPSSVHKAGVSMRGRSIPDDGSHEYE